ncbi:uncharacterized protein LOC111021219 [Momordica charantia]|uniref:Uncharacterized protein LOC111021219 n=1 Tax=Momordica charantia TaxID=3673 RepID=A0A6J1DIG9_MOMCH|nr:uncharacterized protein LOC111021219 [Momordica charantia]
MGVEEQVLIGVLLGMVAVAVGVADPPQVSNVTAMYLLGDSSVDCGLSTLYYPLLHRNFSLFPCEADADADASTLLPHFLAKKIGVPYSQPLYTQNGSIEAILNGLNFGSPQATIMSSSRSYQSLNQQLRQALDAIQMLRLHLGQDTAHRFIQSSNIM